MVLFENELVQRGWKSMESARAEGQRIHYNFVMPHQALEGMTPTQRGGIGNQSTWVSLLGEALKESK